MFFKKNMSQQNLINEAIDELTSLGKELINKKKKFTATDFIDILEQIEEFAIENFQSYTSTQIKNITLKSIQQLQEFVKDFVDEQTYSIIKTILIGAPTLYNIIERALLKRLDVNGDGEISMEECCSCFGKS